jgi:hypothetical protein
MFPRDAKGRAPRAHASRRAWRGGWVGTVVLAGALSLAAAIAFSGCGGASSEPSTIRASRDTVTSGVRTKRPFRGTGGFSHNDDNPARRNRGLRGGAEPVASGPCGLVSAARASTILAVPVRTPVEAPLGPTCIYQAEGSPSYVTVAIDSVPISQLLDALHGRTRSSVAGVQVYCGDEGEPTTYAPLGGGRVLAVGAPCAIGRRFAAAALQRTGHRPA